MVTVKPEQVTSGCDGMINSYIHISLRGDLSYIGNGFHLTFPKVTMAFNLCSLYELQMYQLKTKFTVGVSSESQYHYKEYQMKLIVSVEVSTHSHIH